MKNIKAFIKGWIGEAGINIAATLCLPNKQYKRFKNITLPTENGTSQIDHIFVSKYGVFVVETKNMRGWIFGKQYDKYWTQKFPRSTYKFQNPLRQNYGHIKAIQNLVPNIPEETFISVIAMCGEHKIKSELPENVTRGAWFVKYIRTHKSEILTEAQIIEISAAIKSSMLPKTKETKRLHVSNVRKALQEDRNQ